MKMFCKNCGKENLNTSNYCENCGEVISNKEINKISKNGLIFAKFVTFIFIVIGIYKVLTYKTIDYVWFSGVYNYKNMFIREFYIGIQFILYIIWADHYKEKIKYNERNALLKSITMALIFIILNIYVLYKM